MATQVETSAPVHELTRSLAQLVAERAAENPDAVAIEDGARQLTYAELDAAGGRIAAGLLAAGVEGEEVVGVCLPRSWQAICAFLGVLRAGAAYVPVNPAHPAHRQRQLLDLAGARLALTGEAHGQRLPEQIESLDAERLVLTGANGPDPEPGGDRLAYVLFTSGSTGNPKGVEVTHRNLVHLLRSSADLVALPDDTALHGAPLEFDMSVLEIWGALVNGARLVLAPPGLPDPARLGQLIAAREITKIIVSPGMLNELVQSALADLGGLRLIVAGGDVLSPEAVARLRSAHPSIRLLNAYGPTEATITATSFEVVEADGAPVPIGRPHPGYLLYVLDESGEPAPEGEPGELWIGGPGVARGYRNDPEQTAERFQENPFGSGTVYRTGDQVRVRTDGELLFLGRLDEQVKIGGQRIEPGEVERALTSNAAVLEAVVVAREDVPGHKRLVAYAAVGPDSGASAPELREHLTAQLPPFMVPGSIVPLERLPRNERGKVDRSALPAPRREAGDATADPRLVPVAETMAEVLKLDSVGPHEDFFDLGGTSLLALQLTGRLRERLHTQLDIGVVFDQRTAAALADRIGQGRDRIPEMPPLSPTPHESTAPVSGAQRRTWFFGHMNPDSIAFQFAAIFRLEGRLDEDALRGALGELMERHEILRTSFEERNGEPAQVVHAEVSPDLESVDLRGKGHDAWPKLIRSRVRARVDPAEAPLVHWTLARVGEESWTLLQVEHHLIHDGWSFAVLAGELAELYSARVEDRSADLPEPTVQFQDYARWEREAHRGLAVAQQVEHWARTLNPNPPLLELPGAQARPSRESFAGGSVRLTVESGLDGGLRSLARESRTTLFMVTLAAFLVQLRRYSGQDDLQVGSGLANRRDPAAERLIGMVVNTAVLRCDLGGDPTVRELLERVRQVAVDAYANADAPFEAVVDAVRAHREPGRSPLIQALFSFHDAPRNAERWAGLDVRQVEGVPNGTAKADLNVIGIAKADGGLTFIWEHSDLLSDAAAARLAGHHLRLLEQFAAHPDAPLSDLDLLTEEERTQIERWNAAPDSYAQGETIHGLVGAQARHDPDADAILDGSSRLTYRELLERAQGVATTLRERGVEHGDRVGVRLGRSTEAAVAQLGVLSAGAAYVPLDPQYPAARISRLLEDAGVAIILTNDLLRRRLPVGLAALDVDEAAARQGPAAVADVGPEDLAYIIYTSGSTGEPKGVEVSHRNVVRLVDDPAYAELGAGTVMLHAASPAFDAATLEVWGPLANGGTVACLAEQPSADAVAEAIGQYGVTTLWLTAGLFHQLVDRRPESLSAVHQLLAGGDVLSPDHVRRALAALPANARLTNGYGPTETTTFATTHDLRPGEPVDDAIPIGRPIQATTCDVLDPAGQPLPVGAAGELAIGGDGVARGYRGDPELTAARFQADPGRNGGRRYLTGDRVRRRADGALEFLGRLDRQVKVRGTRVEPAEVENALRAHPAVADTAVTPFEPTVAGPALAAYLVFEQGSPHPPAAELRKHAAARLQTAMVPTAWVTLPSLPLNANGKLDRDRLPPPGSEHLAREDSDIGPRSATERRVVKCFEEILGVRPVGVEDDFFALGGHSLLAVALFAELEQIGGHRLPLSTIFEASTPRTLAACLGTEAPASRWDNLVALKPHGNRPPLFVVAAGDGNIVGFGPLARHMSAEQPFYALQPSGLDGRRPLDSGIQTMATRYLTALRRVQPHGPYLLAGRCNGSTVAFEMAQQLRAEGESVPLLLALDSPPPAPKPRELAPGIPYDQIMESASIRAQMAGEEVPDLNEQGGAARLVEWLRAPLAPGVSRYLHEFWRARSDLREAWPDPLGADAADLAGFAWAQGLDELVPAMLLPTLVPGCRTPDDQAWDWVMAAVWSELSERPADPLSVAGWNEFRAHLVEPMAGGKLTRYLLGAWSRSDLRAAFPQPLGESADALRAWAWLHGIDQGLAPELLPEPPGPLSRRRRLELALRPAQTAAVRIRDRASRGSQRLASEARLRAIEELERRLKRPLSGAGARTIHRSLAAARKARAGYRADPWPDR
ncbi:MAG TPA: amino acid adenylation domain-containing protein, partial [Solirubrobacterales bacterium]|nr:amino acid adenylation domain-containing protein [Solirubrobacterales bacterium]